MSLCNFETALARVKIANPDSPLVIAKSDMIDMVDVFPYNTVYGRQFVAANPKSLIGIYDNTHTKKEVNHAMRKAYRNDYAKLYAA